jgi:hypothetical protein
MGVASSTASEAASPALQRVYGCLNLVILQHGLNLVILQHGLNLVILRKSRIDARGSRAELEWQRASNGKWWT